jgi:hypothetical protein
MRPRHESQYRARCRTHDRSRRRHERRSWLEATIGPAQRLIDDVIALRLQRGLRPTGRQSERQGTYTCSADFICATGIAASTTIGDVGFHIDAHSATQGLARLTDALARATNLAAAASHTTGATIVHAVRRRDALIIATGCVSRTTGQITAPTVYGRHICGSQKVSAADPCFQQTPVVAGRRQWHRAASCEEVRQENGGS